MTSLSFVVATVLLLFAAPSHAYPYGAGDCPANGAAVGGAHLSGTGGSLADGEFYLSLDGVTLTSDTAIDFTIGTSHTLSLYANNLQFRGFLIRIGDTSDSVDVTTSLTVPSDYSSIVRLASDVCSGYRAGGLTQIDEVYVSEVSGVLQLDTEASNLQVDVTVVMDMNNYYYGKFFLNAVSSGGTSPSTSSPTSSGTSAPTPSGTSAPTSAATPAPTPVDITSLPTETPPTAEATSPPSSAPIVAPTSVTAPPTPATFEKASDFPSLSPSKTDFSTEEVPSVAPVVPTGGSAAATGAITSSSPPSACLQIASMVVPVVFWMGALVL